MTEKEDFHASTNDTSLTPDAYKSKTGCSEDNNRAERATRAYSTSHYKQRFDAEIGSNYNNPPFPEKDTVGRRRRVRISEMDNNVSRGEREYSNSYSNNPQQSRYDDRYERGSTRYYANYNSEDVSSYTPNQADFRDKYEERRSYRRSYYGNDIPEFSRPQRDYSSHRSDYNRREEPYAEDANPQRYYRPNRNLDHKAYGDIPYGRHMEPSYRNNNYRTPYKPKIRTDREQADFYSTNENNRGFSKPRIKKPKLQQRIFKPRPKPIKYTTDHLDMSQPLRLNKFMANSGVCSRREADELIKQGKVSVNGEIVTELGTKVLYTDSIMLNGQELKIENKVYVLLNKPKNCVTTSEDPQERLTVLDLVKKACKERIYPVGRLDRNTTGVLLLTNDGDLATRLMHPKFDKKKIYHVWLDKAVSVEHMQQIADGIQLDDGEIHADAISYASPEDLSQVGIEIHSGRNRIVRRIFEHLGYKVYRLDRVYFAGLTKKNLGRGKWRFLSQEEVNMLRMGAFE